MTRQGWTRLTAWIPLIAFAIFPTLIVVLIYIWPTLQRLGLIFGLCILVSFLIFVWRKRKDQLAAIATVVPNVIGPYFSQIYVSHQTWTPGTSSPVPDLSKVLHDGGDVLVQIAFFFASLVAMAVYLLSRMTKGHQKDRVSTIFFLFIVFAMILTNKDFFFSTYFRSRGFLPDVTPFFVARFLIALNGIVLATWPGTSRPASAKKEIGAKNDNPPKS